MTMTRAEARDKPQRALLNAHFVVYPFAPRQWVIEGIEGGMCEGYWRKVGSAQEAKDVVIREMERQIKHLNDFIDHQRERIKALREQASPEALVAAREVPVAPQEARGGA